MPVSRTRSVGAAYMPPVRLPTTTAGTDDALPGAQLPGDARMSSRRACAPKLVHTRERRNGFRVTAPFPAPTLGSPDVKKASFGSFLRVGTKVLPCTSFVQSQVPAQPPRSLDSAAGGAPLRATHGKGTRRRQDKVLPFAMGPCKGSTDYDSLRAAASGGCSHVCACGRDATSLRSSQ